ncbi:hypothetical protein H8957_017687, partial [Semnopithecus entellus]
RIRTSFFMSVALGGRPPPARMEWTPLTGSAHPTAPPDSLFGRRDPPRRPLSCFPAREPGQHQLRLLRPSGRRRRRRRRRRGRRHAARDTRFRNANALRAGIAFPRPGRRSAGPGSLTHPPLGTATRETLGPGI